MEQNSETKLYFFQDKNQRLQPSGSQMSLLALPVIPGEILHDLEFFMKVFRSEIQSQRTVSVVMEGMMSFDPKMLQIYMSLLS